MATEEVTEWETTAADNAAIHPTGPRGRDSSRISRSFQELQAAIARWRDTLSAGGGGLATIDDTTISGSPANHEITFDETAYDKIRIVLKQVQPATDGVSLYLIVGEANGGTMYNSTNDYDGHEITWEGDAVNYSETPDSNRVRVLSSCSNAANETISGEIIISGFVGSDTGCIIESKLTYVNSSSNIRTIETKTFLDAGAAVDTYRLFWASGNFANNGSIKTEGYPV